ncbi:MAG: hypothetical protein WCF84_01035 [Anaerolineae bacterium]
MNNAALVPWRDLSLILLCLESFILMLVPGVLLFFAQKYLRRFRRWLRLPILRVYVYTLRAQNITANATNGIVEVPIRLHMLGAQVSATVRHLVARGQE